MPLWSSSNVEKKFGHDGGRGFGNCYAWGIGEGHRLGKGSEMTNDKRSEDQYLGEFQDDDGNQMFDYRQRSYLGRIVEILPLEKRGWFLLWTVVGMGEGEGAEMARQEAMRIVREAQ